MKDTELSERIRKNNDLVRTGEDKKLFNQAKEDYQIQKLANQEFEARMNPEINKSKLVSLREDVKTQLLLQNRTSATELIVQHIEKEEIIKTTRDDDKSEMWIYKEGIYISQGKTYIQEYTREILDEVYTTQICNQIISKIEADTFTDQEEFFNEQNNYPYLIPVNNGILNIYTREISPFTPKIPFFNKLSMNYNEEAKAKQFEKFLKEILPKDREDLYLTIQELFGFCLLKEYKYEKSFMFEGKGRNGKSKLLTILQKLIGKDNYSNISLQTLEGNDNFAMSQLQNKLINISGDLSKEAIGNTGNFKQLTGRDDITANRKFKNHVTFQNYAKMIFSANELPPVNDITAGFWLRWILIPFPNQFLPQKELDLIENKENVYLQNPTITKNIIDYEMEGLLNWSLDGLKRLNNKKDFSYMPSKDEVKNTWLRKSNSVMAFIQDHIKQDYDSKITKQDFRRSYSFYCNIHKIKPVSDKVIKICLENNLGASDTRMLFENSQIRIWDGIKFRQGSQGSQGISPYIELSLFP